QVRDRATQLSTGPARPQPRQAHAVRRPAPREAEGQADLRRAREPVPDVLPVGRGAEGRDGREPAPAARAPARQRGAPARIRGLAPRGPPDGGARALPGERPESLGAVVPGEGGWRGPAPVDLEGGGASRRQPERGPWPGAPGAGGRPQREEGDRAQPAAPRRHPDPRGRAAHRRAVQQVGKRAGAPMSRIPFQKPKKVEWEILSDQYGRLVAEPFEKGYALTVGNSLRRTLLSIVPGAAV